ncbi:MAG TPA: ATP-binding protein [Granulicella sp.]
MLKHRFSISLRLTLWFGVIFFAGWVLFGTSMWFHLKHTLTSERRLTLTRRMDRLQDLLTRNKSESEDDRIEDFRDFAYATGNGLSEVLRSDGERALPSPSEAARNFAWPAVPQANGSQTNEPESFLHVESNGAPYWVMIRRTTIAGSEPLVLMAAAPEAGNLTVLESFWTGLMISAPVLLLISLAGGYWISRRALGPVDQITAKARSISIRNLSERLPVAETRDELERLAETCNVMLDGLESAVNRLKQFTADASHELRGPLSFVRTVAEIGLRSPEADAISQQAFREIVDEVAKATEMLENLLTLARADDHVQSAELVPVDLNDVVAEACGMAQSVAERSQVSLSITGPRDPVTVLGDFSSLRRLLWIVLDNALKYTEGPGRVEVVLNTREDEAVIVVRDTGIGIAEQDLPHIFDRFYRADPSRSQVEGNGMGLAIAAWIAELHDARLSVTSKESIGTTVRIEIPLAAARSHAGAWQPITPMNR